MNSQGPPCPEIDCWQALLGDTIAETERAIYERHLDSCSACQERLRRIDEGDDGLRQLGRRVGDPTATREDPTLLQVLERLHAAKAPSRTAPLEPADLYFLRPSGRPGVLGLLGDYEVREVIGQGGMGVVLKAFEPALHRLVAIKVMATALAGSATARRRFTREAQAAAAVCHDHIIAVHGVDAIDGLPYLVMQYVDGESLQDRLDRAGPLETAEVLRIGLQTASGLAAAHAQGLIHRDIKPANLLLENGLARVKITDFGLARMTDDVGLTQNGEVAGTPEYMSPEQARGEAVDHRADLFSLGSVLYACCTGVPPFRGSTALAVLSHVSEKEPASLRSLNADVPAWLEAFIARLMAKDPAHRFQSAAEVAQLLEGYLAHLRQPTAVPAPEVPSSPLVIRPGGPTAQRRMTTRNWGRAVIGLVSVFGLLIALVACALSSRGVPDVDLGTSPAGAFSTGGVNSLEPADGLVCLLVNKNSGRCLSIADGSLTPGARIVQGPMPDQARATERWTLLSAGDGFRLRNERSGLVLGIGGGNLDPGVQAIQWHDLVKTPNQHWIFEPAEDGYVLRAEHSQLVLGIRNSSPDAGGEAVQWHYVPGVADQCWELRPPYREEAYWPLKGELEGHSQFGLFGLDAEQGVNFEPAGLRIAFPPGNPKDHPDTGVALGVTVKGDFEITVRFEVLQEAKVAAASRCETRFALHAVADGPERAVATLRRQSGIREGIRFLALMRREDGNGGKHIGAKEMPTTAKSGRLRFVRADSALSCYVSEGADGPFTFLRRYSFGEKDVKEVRIAGAAGPEAVFDVRATDLRIRADSLSNVPQAALSQIVPSKSELRGWLVRGALTALVVLLLITVPLGVRLYGRPRRRHKAGTPAGSPAAGHAADADTAPASVSFACSGCGKRLRVKTLLAGKKVRCPQCGQGVSVPSIPSSNTARLCQVNLP
jgi:serine/threonine protein kinase